jgi:hypothetical protein
MDVTLAPGRAHTTEARAGPRRSELDTEVIALLLLVFLPAGGQSRSDSCRGLHSE